MQIEFLWESFVGGIGVWLAVFARSMTRRGGLSLRRGRAPTRFRRGLYFVFGVLFLIDGIRRLLGG
jgi:hypothetical protein